jgi:hypothetical protein
MPGGSLGLGLGLGGLGGGFGGGLDPALGFYPYGSPAPHYAQVLPFSGMVGGGFQVWSCLVALILWLS